MPDTVIQSVQMEYHHQSPLAAHYIIAVVAAAVVVVAAVVEIGRASCRERVCQYV